MPDKKITELSAIVTIANNDVLPIVDISENITKKIDIAQLKAQSPVQSVNAKVGIVTLNKGDIGLSEVDNTSDANKPISTATQTALDAKQDTLVSGTTIKTINSSSILGSGNISVAPSTGINATAISTGVVSNAEFNYLDGVTSGIQAQLDNKVDENAAILAATKIKITYDTKGLITSGADATTADIASSSDKRYVTDAQLVVIANTSGINTGDQTLAGLGGVAANTAIVGATKTKISYDSKGLVTSGADATTADIADSTNKRYVTDANLTTIANTSGTNTGDNATNSQYSGLAASKQDALTLTTTGTSGAATLIGATLNIPQYSGGGGGTTWGSITGTLSTQTDLQTALDAKVDENAAITGATKTKITYDAKGLITAGADATTADIADSTNKRYVTDANLTVIGNTSGTNSGNQTLANTSDPTSHTVTLSSTGGSVQLVEGSGITLTTTGTTADGIITIASTGGGGTGTVTSVAALTLGTTGTDLSSSVVNSSTTPVITLNVPTASATNRGALSSANWSTFNGKQDALVSGTNIKTINSTSILGSGNLVVAAAPSGVSGAIQFSDGSSLSSDATNFFWDNSNKRLGISINTPTAKLHVKGSGTTSGTSSFKVDNSASTNLFNILDNGDTYAKGLGVNQTLTGNFSGVPFAVNTGSMSFSFTGTVFGFFNTAASDTVSGQIRTSGLTISNVLFGTPNGSAMVDVESTTKGFLPPRMTTTQKNAISSPAAGLIVFDTSLTKLCVYSGSAWQTITSV